MTSGQRPMKHWFSVHPLHKFRVAGDLLLQLFTYHISSQIKIKIRIKIKKRHPISRQDQ